MSKKLVAYFSASGITAKVAEDLADAIGADIFEIRPEVPYTKADLNWMDKKSRSTIEMSNPDFRPAIAVKRDNMDEYPKVFSQGSTIKHSLHRCGHVRNPSASYNRCWHRKQSESDYPLFAQRWKNHRQYRRRN